jgi:hypothetical protein
VAQFKAPGRIFVELQAKIREKTITAAADEIVDVEQPDLDLGEALGVRFSSDIEQSHSTSNCSHTMVEVSSEAHAPNVDLRIDVKRGTFELSLGQTYTETARLFLEEQLSRTEMIIEPVVIVPEGTTELLCLLCV